MIIFSLIHIIHIMNKMNKGNRWRVGRGRQRQRQRQRQLWPFKHLFRVMRRHDMTKKGGRGRVEIWTKFATKVRKYVRQGGRLYLEIPFPLFILFTLWIRWIRETDEEWGEEGLSGQAISDNLFPYSYYSHYE